MNEEKRHFWISVGCPNVIGGGHAAFRIENKRFICDCGHDFTEEVREVAKASVEQLKELPAENTPVTSEYANERLKEALARGDQQEIEKWDMVIRSNNELRIRAKHAARGRVCDCKICKKQ